MTDSKTFEQLETDFWQALVDQDVEAAGAMIAQECLIIGPSGAMKIDPAKYRAMMADGNWRLDSFEFSDVAVIKPAPDTAIIAYKVRQKGEMKDAPMDLTSADSTTWVKVGSKWKCAVHTETILENV